MPTKTSRGGAEIQESSPKPQVVIVGAGIGGLVLALELHRVGIDSHIYESAAEIRPLGVGINLLPHSTRILGGLGLEPALAAMAVTTKESVFYNRFGQFIAAEPAGRDAGYVNPQFSVHRGDLQLALLDAVRTRLGENAVVTDHRCLSVNQTADSATVNFSRNTDGTPLPSVETDIVVGCDGVHSVIRKQFYPDEGEPRYSGITMWRGMSIAKPFLTGASMARIGWFDKGKLVIYPIQDNADGKGNQLINWVAEIEGPQRVERDWNEAGRLEDFADAFKNWHFDWLDVPALIQGAETILEYPMVDQDPLPRWTFGRVTLLGDAAHPMVPRGSNGAGQAILDGNRLATLLDTVLDPLEALAEYEAERLPSTGAVVRANRTIPPDSLLGEVWERTRDRPFERIEDVITPEEIAAISHRYQEIAGFTPEELNGG